jgi:hypothetical protein
MGQQVGLRSTAQAVSESTLVRSVDDSIVMLEPNETPLVTFLMRLKKRTPVNNFKHEWPEDDYTARWANLAAAVAAVDTTTFTVVDSKVFVIGDMFCIPRAASSSVAPEVCRVTDVNRGTNVITVVRGVGGTTASTYSSGDALRLLGSAAEEGSTPPEAKNTTFDWKFTYTQIFKTSVNLTKSQVAMKQYGKPSGERKREQKKKLAEHKIKMNMAALFGAAGAGTGPNGNPLRTTAGLNSVIETNKIDAGGQITPKTFEKFARASFRYGSAQKLLIAAPVIISFIHELGNSKLLVKPQEKVFGVDVERIITGHGEFLLVRDWMLEDGGGTGTNGFGGMAFAVDVDNCEYIYLNGNGENRDTKLHEDVIKDGKDAYTDEILTEGGFKFAFEKKFAKLYNVTDYTTV